MKIWYCTRSGERSGPFSATELKTLADEGKLQPADLLWKEGMSAWAPASSARGLFPAPSRPEPPPAPAAMPLTPEPPPAPRPAPIAVSPPDQPIHSQAGEVPPPAAAVPAKQWWYESAGGRKGPVPHGEMVILISGGSIGRDSAVWAEGMSDWGKLEATELREHLQGPPPLTGMYASNSVVWVLAFAPLIGYLLEYIVAYALQENSFMAELAMAGSKYWYITLFLNIGLSYMDENRLVKGGVDTSKFKGMTWLVPVYLFQRSKALNHGPAYFITWIVCFVLPLLF